jgi:hypothetical protein
MIDAFRNTTNEQKIVLLKIIFQYVENVCINCVFQNVL